MRRDQERIHQKQELGARDETEGCLQFLEIWGNTELPKKERRLKSFYGATNWKHGPKTRDNNSQTASGLQVSKVEKQWQTLFWGAPKSLQMVIAAMKLKDAYSLEGKL